MKNFMHYLKLFLLIITFSIFLIEGSSHGIVDDGSPETRDLIIRLNNRQREIRDILNNKKTTRCFDNYYVYHNPFAGFNDLFLVPINFNIEKNIKDFYSCWILYTDEVNNEKQSLMIPYCLIDVVSMREIETSFRYFNMFNNVKKITLFSVLLDKTRKRIKEESLVSEILKDDGGYLIVADE